MINELNDLKRHYNISKVESESNPSLFDRISSSDRLQMNKTNTFTPSYTPIKSGHKSSLNLRKIEVQSTEASQINIQDIKTIKKENKKTLRTNIPKFQEQTTIKDQTKEYQKSQDKVKAFITHDTSKIVPKKEPVQIQDKLIGASDDQTKSTRDLTIDDRSKSLAYILDKELKQHKIVLNDEPYGTDNSKIKPLLKIDLSNLKSDSQNKLLITSGRKTDSETMLSYRNNTE